MPKRVKMPDGQIVAFPDTHTDDEIGQFIDTHFPETATPASDFDAQVQEAKQEANPVTAFVRGGIAGYGLNAQNLNTERQPNPFGSPIPSAKAVYQAEKEVSPKAYGTGELVGSFLPSPLSIAKWTQKGGKVVQNFLSPAIEGAVNAFNTSEEGDGIRSAAVGFGTGGGLGVLGKKIGDQLDPLAKKLGSVADRMYARSMGYLDRGQENAMKLLQNPARLSRLRQVGESEGIGAWSGAQKRMGKIDAALDRYSEKSSALYSAADELEQATGSRFGISPQDFIDSTTNRLKDQKFLMPRDVFDSSGNRISRDYIPSGSNKTALAETFGTAQDDLRKLTPLVEKTQGNTTKLQGPLPIASSAAFLKNLQRKSRFDTNVSSSQNDLSKMQAGIARELEEKALTGSKQPILQELLDVKKRQNPLLDLQTLTEADLGREANKKVAGLLTPMEAIGLMGGGYTLGDKEGALGLPLALLAARRYGFPALYSSSKGLGKLSSSISPSQMEDLMGPLRYYMTKENK